MKLQKRNSKEFGGGLVEYAMLVALISVVAIGAVQTFGANLAGENPEAQVNFDRIYKKIDGSGDFQT